MIFELNSQALRALHQSRLLREKELHMEKQGFDEWALVELMGHQRIAGRVTEQTVGGTAFVRVDVPASEGTQALTKLLGSAAIYAITPVSEETARKLARGINAAPISVWDARRMLAGKKVLNEEASDDEDDADEEDNDFH